MSWVLVAAALACLLGEYLDLPEVVYVAKPAATLAIVAIAARVRDPVTSRYQLLIVLGLLASLAGDVLLMLPGDLFVPGLASFLVAHILYIGAFASHGGGVRDPFVALVMCGIAAAMLLYLWPALGPLAAPVSVYVAVIATMAWQAVARWRGIGGAGAGYAAAGALCFLASDSALAIRRFRVEFPLATVVVLGTYWVAQWCIARSVTRHAPSA